MPKFRQKQTLIEAVQFDPDVLPWPRGVEAVPCYCVDLAQDGRHCPNHPKPVEFRCYIQRPDRMLVNTYRTIEKGDWVVSGWRGGASDILKAAVIKADYEQVDHTDDQHEAWRDLATWVRDYGKDKTKFFIDQLKKVLHMANPEHYAICEKAGYFDLEPNTKPEPPCAAPSVASSP